MTPGRYQSALKAPFPWFGGKSRVTDVVWHAFGPDIPNYVEPFAGSLAVLLGRPGGHGPKETVNDKDHFISNFWEAVKNDPKGVVEYTLDPVHELLLNKRHRWLVNQDEFIERMETETDYYDVKVAGWWVWGKPLWIGGGWCNRVPSPHRKIPDIFHRKGVHSHKPQLTVRSGIHCPLGSRAARKRAILEWFERLADRLCMVNVCCKDWTCVVKPSVLGLSDKGSTQECAVFLDPPYDTDIRTGNLYAQDEVGISADVRAWAIENGDNPRLRIALCGYESEHVMPANWTVYAWKPNGGLGNQGKSNTNRFKERIWFSPHCLPIGGWQRELGLGEEK